MPEIVPPVPHRKVVAPAPTDPTAEPRKRRGRPPKAPKAPRAQRGPGPIETAFGKQGVLAARLLPPEQRKELAAALRARDADTAKLDARMVKLTARIMAIRNAVAIVAGFEAKLKRVADALAGDESHE